MEPLLVLSAAMVVVQARTRHWAMPVVGVLAAVLHGLFADAPTPWIYASLMVAVNVVVFSVPTFKASRQRSASAHRPRQFDGTL